MANNIFQRQVTPAKPNVLEGERIFVYVPQATTDVAGIASYNSDDFVVTNAGKVKIKWPYAHNRVFGLVKVEDNSTGYLKFTDDENHYLEVDSEKIKINIVDAAITVHNESEEAHPYIQEKIQLAKEEVTAAITVHNESEEAHPYIQEKIAISYEELTSSFNDKLNNKVNIEASYNKKSYHIINDGFSGITLGFKDSQISNAIVSRLRIDESLTTLSGKEVYIKANGTVEGKYSENLIKLTPTTFTLNDRNIALEEYVDNKIAEITAVHIRNKEPNLVVNATQDTVQEVATQYIVDNYERQPEANDGLFITFTDKNNDVIKYAYFNNAWVNVGLNDVDLSNYVDLNTTQTITGNKDFRGVVTKNGVVLATEIYVDEHIASEIEQLDKDSRKLLILGGNGTIGTNVNFVIENPESFAIYKNNLTEFIMSLIVPVTGEIDLTKEVTIDFGDTSYYLFNAVNTTQRLTLGDLNFALRESLVTGYNYLFRAIFFNNADSVGFAVLPDRDQVLSLNSDQMDNYIAEGGLPNGQLVICNRVITNGYTEGGIYRFKITYPDTYEFEELSTGGSGGTVAIDNQTITKNSNDQIQAVALKDKMIVRVNNSLVTTNFNGLVELTKEELNTLETTGTVILSTGITLTYDNGTIYVTDSLDLIQELSLSQSGSVLTSLETFNTHVQIMVEFETEGMHYGVDFVLHPYDSSICLVSYNFVGHTGTAYLDENGYVVINVPDSLTFTNIKGHFVDLGG